MTDRDIEKKWNEMIDQQAPSLWDRIELRLQEEKPEAVPEIPGQQEPDGFFRKLKQFMFGGGTLRTAVSLTCIAIVCTAVGGGLFGMGRMGSAGGYYSAKGASAASSSPLAAGAGAYDSMVAADEAAAEGGEYEYGSNAKAETSAAQSASGSTEPLPENSARKLIRNLSIITETTEFDSLIEKISAQTSQAGGYIESSNVIGSSYSSSYSRLRHANLTLRIPSGKTDAFLEMLGGESNIVSRSEDMTDVTLQYVDMESHIKALRTEEEQLLKLMEKAESTQDLILIQSELTDVRYQIESCQSRLNTYDNLVDYDTINLSVDEVKQETLTGEPTVLQRIREGLANNTVNVVTGIGEFIIWLITMIPVFVVLFLVILVIVGLIRRLNRRRKNKKSK